MMNRLFRLLKRLAVLCLGVVVVFASLDYILPYFNQRLPLILALFATYCLVAYIFIPVCLRLVRLFWTTNHIPTHTVTPDGFACDPINIAIVATKSQLMHAFNQAGWHSADQKTWRTMFRYGMSLLLNRPYPNAPFSTLYLFGRPQDIGLQKPLEDSPRHRHHIRFWQVIEPPHGSVSEHVAFWRKHYRLPLKKKSLWVGAATEDIGIGIIKHNAQFTHRIHPNTDQERRFIVKQLQRTGLVRSVSRIQAGAPFQLPNRVLGVTMYSDGLISLLDL